MEKNSKKVAGRYRIGDVVTIVENGSLSKNAVGDTGIIADKDIRSYRVQVKGRPGYANWHRYADIRHASSEEIMAYENENMGELMQWNDETKRLECVKILKHE